MIVGLVLVGVLLLLGLAVIVLEVRERMQDAVETRKMAPAMPL